MKTVYKYTIEPVPGQIIEMPEGAEILCVQTQYGDNICIWAAVDPKAPSVRRAIEILVTGGTVVSIDGKYIGTVQLIGGTLVLHVYDRGEVK